MNMEVIVVKEIVNKETLTFSNDIDKKKAEAKKLLASYRKMNVPEIDIQRMIKALWRTV